MAAYIAVSGSIACGKTTLCKTLAQTLQCHAFWEDADQNPFLSAFYHNYPSTREYAFLSQMWFLYYKHAQLEEIARLNELALVERCLDENLLFAQLVLGEEEYKIYMDYYNLIASSMHQPVLIIYISVSLEEQIARIRKRAIPHEQRIEQAYLTKLNSLYERWVSTCLEIPVLQFKDGESSFKQIEDRVREEVEKHSQAT